MIRIATTLAAAIVIGACSAGPSTASPTASPVAGARPTGGSAAIDPAASAEIGLGERSQDGGGIEITASWVTTDPPELQLAMDTHSVDLDKYDLAALAELRLDGGAWTAPSAVDLPKGGHHRGGTLRFAAITPSAFASARLIEIRIVDVVVAERMLTWDRGR